MMTAAEAAVRVMESEGVDVVFGIPGASILPLYHALQACIIPGVAPAPSVAASLRPGTAG